MSFLGGTCFLLLVAAILWGVRARLRFIDRWAEATLRDELKAEDRRYQSERDEELQDRAETGAPGTLEADRDHFRRVETIHRRVRRDRQVVVLSILIGAALFLGALIRLATA